MPFLNGLWFDIFTKNNSLLDISISSVINFESVMF